MKFAVTGGDIRAVKLCGLLKRKGHTVSACALGDGEDIRAFTAETPEAAVENADCIVLPLPVSKGEGLLYAPLDGRAVSVGRILSAARRDAVLFAGMPDCNTRALAEEKGLILVDYAAREEFAVENACATAEGAVQVLLTELPTILCGKRCLVVGYGRIGKLIARKLSALGVFVTVSARRASDIALIRAFGYDAADTRALAGTLDGYDMIVNTVPAPVLDEALLREVKRDCFCLDLASSPYGIDREVAEKLGLRAMLAPGLPARTAPLTAAEAIRNTIYNVLAERGVTV